MVTKLIACALLIFGLVPYSTKAQSVNYEEFRGDTLRIVATSQPDDYYVIDRLNRSDSTFLDLRTVREDTLTRVERRFKSYLSDTPELFGLSPRDTSPVRVEYILQQQGPYFALYIIRYTVAEDSRPRVAEIVEDIRTKEFEVLPPERRSRLSYLVSTLPVTSFLRILWNGEAELLPTTCHLPLFNSVDLHCLANELRRLSPESLSRLIARTDYLFDN